MLWRSQFKYLLCLGGHYHLGLRHSVDRATPQIAQGSNSESLVLTR